jgi:para-aminobenzoate synthetase component 1
LPLAGGWIGWLSYEAGLAVQGIRSARLPDGAVPAARFALYDTLAVFDHAAGRWSLVGVDWPDGVFPERPPVQVRLARLGEMLGSAPAAAAPDLSLAVCARPVAEVDRSGHVQQVLRIKRYIEAGDVYQVNLTRRFATETAASAGELYRRLRLANPADFAALIRWEDQAVISSSPELFLHLQDGVALTRPIKGTRPRVGDALLDDIFREELARSPKDRAELTMIVDLLRNDLGRVSEYGSVEVLQSAELERHPTVYHLVGTIRSRLRLGLGWADLLRASFPGGSITGAPKIRAMQIIDELEQHQRGVYCGAIGYVGLDGSMMMNIAIRTMELHGGRLRIAAGGGIVADSDPDAEYEETLAKAAGMFRALGHEAGQAGLRPAGAGVGGAGEH